MTALAYAAEEPRPIGRPSLAAPYRLVVLGLLRDNSAIPSLEVLAQVRGMGYPGGKSALYQLVAQVRADHGIASPATLEAAERDRRRRERERARAERVAQLAQWTREDQERKQRRAREREEKLQREALAREERARERAGLPVVAAAPEAPLDPTRLRAIGRAWLASRVGTHKDIVTDRSRWRRNLEPHFGALAPGEIDVAKLRTFIDEKRATGLSSSTIGRCIGLLSSLFTQLVEEGVVAVNPVARVPKMVRRLYRNACDPQSVAFIEDKDQIRRLIAELPALLRTMYTVAVRSGVRTGELVAARWEDLRNGMRVLHVSRRFRNGRVDTPKNGKARAVPLSPACTEALRAWREQTTGEGLIFKPLVGASDNGHVAMSKLLKLQGWNDALARVGLPAMTFYIASRHTFASQMVMDGVPIEKVSRWLGHSGIGVTQAHYLHLRPEALAVPDTF